MYESIGLGVKEKYNTTWPQHIIYVKVVWTLGKTARWAVTKKVYICVSDIEDCE